MTEISGYGGTYRILGLNNDIFNTNDLLEAEIAAIDAEIAPVENNKKNLENELAIWKEFQTKINNFTKAMEELKKFDFNARTTSYSSEGYFKLSPSASAIEGKYSIEISQLATSHQVAADKVDNIDEALGTNDVIKINGKEITITDDMDLRDMAKAINESDSGVSASIISNRLVLTSKNTGEQNSITLEDGAGGVLKQIGVLSETGDIKTTLETPKDAKYTINGVEGQSASNVITDGLDGSEITLTKKTVGTVEVEIKSDVEKVVTKVKEFVDAYNTVMDNYGYYTGEGTYLQGQSTPLNIKTALSQISGYITEGGNRLYEMGIELNKTGKLDFNEDKLKETYDKNPEIVQDMMFGEKSVAAYMNEKLSRFIGDDGVLQKKITGMDESIKKLDKEIQNFDDMYEYRTKSLYDKYTAFESKMANLNFQLQYMEAQLKALDNSKDK